MQEENKNDVPMVDIDTSGEDTEVILENPKTDIEVETKEEESSPAPQAEEKVEASDEKPEATQEEKPEEKKEELETYSKDVQRRISKLTKKWREAERQKDEALTYAQSQIKAKEEAEKKISRYEPEFFKNAEDSITNGLAAAQAKLAAARQNEDSKAEVEALTAISQLGYEQGKLAELKTQHQMQETAAKEEPVQQQRQPMQQAPARDPKAEAWAEENEWFGKDNAMTYTAFDLHRKLTEEEGMDPQSDDYYKEVDRRIRLEFPHKFDRPVEEKQTTKPTQNVASATRSTKSGRKQVRLTSSQVAIARKLGVPLEEYAKQLINTKEV